MPCRDRRRNISSRALSDRTCSGPPERPPRIPPMKWDYRVMSYTPERRVNVGIVRLEPVAKGFSRQAGGGPGRCALHHKMFAVEEVCGVARVKREFFETLERRKPCARPFPSVTDQV